jgi:hypothetical protein
MTDNASDEGKLVWQAVDGSHMRALTGDVFDYDIIHTPDGQVSWQGMAFGEWIAAGSVDEAKEAAQAEFDGWRK